MQKNAPERYENLLEEDKKKVSIWSLKIQQFSSI